MSDSGGSIYDPDGIDEEKLAFVKELKMFDVGVFLNTVINILRLNILKVKKALGSSCGTSFPLCNSK